MQILSPIKPFTMPKLFSADRSAPGLDGIVRQAVIDNTSIGDLAEHMTAKLNAMKQTQPHNRSMSLAED
jgi:hypothetical protein